MKNCLIILIAFITVCGTAQFAAAAQKTGKATAIEQASPEKTAAVHEQAAAEGEHGEKEELGTILPLWSVLPFAGILLSIALFPLLAPKFWHHHYPKVSAFWALVMAIPFVLIFKGVALHEIAHIYIIDYIPFIILLWSLFTIAGGIYIKGTLKGSPLVNTIILIIGTALASWIGTTGMYETPYEP